MAWLALVLVLCPLPPGDELDLSTPEAAARGWTEVLLDLQFRQLPRIHEPVPAGKDPLAAVLTPRAQKRRTQRQAAERPTTRTRSWTLRVVRVEDAAAGGKRVTLEVARSVEGRDPRTGRWSARPSVTQRSRLDLVPVGAGWRVSATHSACFACKGSATCARCKGTQRSPGITGACAACQGLGRCRTCKGVGYRKDPLVSGGWRLYPASLRVQVTEDLSTPRKAAETWIGLERRDLLRRLRRFDRLTRAVFARLRPALAPDQVQAVDAKLATAELEGKEQFARKPRVVQQVQVKGDRARVVVLTPKDGVFGGGPSRLRLLLRRRGATWRVDGLQHRCPACRQGSGQASCRLCKGSGWRSGSP